MRVFVALDIPGEIRARLAEYVERVRTYAPDARWVKPESLHVTLKFVGEVDAPLLQLIKDALRPVKASPFEVKFAGIGYFPGAKSARVFWAGVHAPDTLAHLAASIDGQLEHLGITPEKAAYRPHLTLARAGTASTQSLRLLQKQLEAEPSPQFGTMTAHEYYLYQSTLSPQGARYAKLERFALA
ncbi:MAG TPA: RNA 2',3'-cyclic phosphodiesterase [Candidatus Angelobacter sp.]|nr:RNA 2',3'-cyclic phosphodiesterase [Candidatus Angelobacter sp.]